MAVGAEVGTPRSAQPQSLIASVVGAVVTRQLQMKARLFTAVASLHFISSAAVSWPR